MPPFVSPSCAGTVENRFAHWPRASCVSVASIPRSRNASRTVSIRPRFGRRLVVFIDTRRSTQGRLTGDEGEEAGEEGCGCEETGGTRCAVSAICDMRRLQLISLSIIPKNQCAPKRSLGACAWRRTLLAPRARYNACARLGVCVGRPSSCGKPSGELGRAAMRQCIQKPLPCG